MKNIKIVISILLIVFSSVILASNSGDKQAVINNIKSMWQAIETNNLPDYLQYIHSDYTVFGEGDAYLHKGKDKEAIDIGDYIGRAKNVRTFMHQPEVIVRGNTAWITYYWNDAGYISNERFTSRGKSTRIFVKEKGKWLCIHSHFTSLP